MTLGIIGKKLGMTQVYNQNRVQPVTAIEAGPCTVTQVKYVVKDGYNAAQLGFGEAKKPKAKENAPVKGEVKFRHLREFRLSAEEHADLGQKIDAGIFKAGDLVDVTGTSKGKGFAGVVKRHHFKGGPKTHGQSDRQRAPGAIGSTTTPGRVYKGTRMAGRMGNVRVTVRGLEVVQADAARNLLLVKGAVPGADNGILLIKKSRKGK